MTCPHCQEGARFVAYRSQSFVSLVGDLCLSRAYYHWAHCQQGHVPGEQTLRLSPPRLTLAAREVTAWAGIQERFGKAAHRTLRKLAGITVCESTAHRTPEAAGERLGQLLEQGTAFGASPAGTWDRDRNGQTCADGSVDLTGILMQGANGATGDGRMVDGGMIFNPQPRGPDEEALAKPCDGVRYWAGRYTLDELGAQSRRQAAQVGMEAAAQWIARSEGGNGLEGFFDGYFPRAVKILDFQHVAGHRGSLARLVRPGPAGEKLLAGWCPTLKHAGGARLVKVLATLTSKPMTAEARSEHQRVSNYRSSNVSRMDYPAYLRQGWQIATGAVESACKTVVKQRLCLGGMRWGEAGSDAVAHLRALYRSDPDQWDAYWLQAA